MLDKTENVTLFKLNMKHFLASSQTPTPLSKESVSPIHQNYSVFSQRFEVFFGKRDGYVHRNTYQHQILHTLRLENIIEKLGEVLQPYNGNLKRKKKI